MRLKMNGQAQDFMPLPDFRVAHDLPDTFGLAYFQPKDEVGLGSIDGAGAVLGAVRGAVAEAVPGAVPAADWLGVVPRLAATFEAALVQANAAIGLREAEISFAVGGFGDVCSAYALALFRAQVTRQPAPDFDAVYADWLWGTVRTAGAVPYDHGGVTWQVRVVYHAYGRVGLMVTMQDTTTYVLDKALACPAEGFMQGLLRAVAAKMAAATV